MRTYLAVALAVLPVSTAFGQTTAWTSDHDSPQHGSQSPVRLHSTPDGGVLSVMRAVRSVQGGAPEALAVKFSANGDQEWQYSVPAYDGAVVFWQSSRIGSAVDAAGNLYIAARGLAADRLVKVDASGQEAWRVDLPTPAGETSHAEFVVVDSSGYPVVGGTMVHSVIPFLFLQKHDPASGAVIWRNDTNGGGMQDFQAGPSGEVVVFGQTDFDPWEHYGLVMTFDSNGTVAWWQNVVSEGYVSLGFGTSWYESIKQGAVDATGRVFAVLEGTYGGPSVNEPGLQIDAFSPSGSRLYSTRISALGAPPVVNDLSVDDLGRVTAVGRDDPSGPFTVWHLDGAGAVDWTATPTVATGFSGQGQQVLVRQDGTSLVTGTRVGSPGQLRAGYRANGTEVFAEMRPIGASPAYDLVSDDRGNVFTLERAAAGTRISKLVDGGQVGAPYWNCVGAPTSVSIRADLRAIGSGAAADDNVTLIATLLPPQTTVLFLASQMQGNVPGVGGGQGTLCLGGAIGRYVGPQQIRRATSGGFASLQIALGETPQPTGLVQAVAGSTWNFQAWFRDANPNPTSNLTNGLSITLQ